MDEGSKEDRGPGDESQASLGFASSPHLLRATAVADEVKGYLRSKREDSGVGDSTVCT